MISSCGDLRAVPVLCRALVLALALAGAGQSAAAAEAPRSILPIEAPTETTPAAPGAVPDAVPDAVPGDTAPKAGIDVAALDAVTVEGIGPLDQGTGGFGDALWADTPRLIIEDLIRRLPIVTGSRALANLRRRLLTSAATVPPPGSVAAESLLLLRAKALLRSDDLAQLGALLAIVPASYHDEALSLLTADAAFLIDDLPHACALASAWVSRSEKAYWQKALIFCEAMAGSWERADFGIELLTELGESDSVFFALMQNLRVADAGAADIPLITAALRPLDIAILRGTRTALPEPGDVTTLPPGMLRSYLQVPQGALATRMALAERAEEVGVIDQADLANIYLSLAENAEQLAAALDADARRRISLYFAAVGHVSSFGTGQAIIEARKHAMVEGRYGQMARLFGPLVGGLQASPDYAWFAPDGALLHVANGKHEAARPWIRLMDRERSADADVEAGWHRARPLIWLAAGGDLLEADAEMLRDWQRAVQERDPANAVAGTALLCGLLEALDEVVPADVWRDLALAEGAATGHHVDLAMLRALTRASAAGRTGEAVAFVLIAMGEGAVGGKPPALLVAAVAALKRLGLDRDARRLAFEIAMAAGLQGP